MNTEMMKADMWVLVNEKGLIVPWVGARATRRQVMAEAAKGCISAYDYYRLSTDSARWKIARRCGYRIVTATVTAHLQGAGNV